MTYLYISALLAVVSFAWYWHIRKYERTKIERDTARRNNKVNAQNSKIFNADDGRYLDHNDRLRKYLKKFNAPKAKLSLPKDK